MGGRGGEYIVSRCSGALPNKEGAGYTGGNKTYTSSGTALNNKTNQVRLQAQKSATSKNSSRLLARNFKLSIECILYCNVHPSLTNALLVRAHFTKLLMK